MTAKKSVLMIVFLFVLFFTNCPVFASSITAPADNTELITVKNEKVNKSFTDLQISGRRPVIEAASAQNGKKTMEENFVRRVNQAIRKIYDDKEEEAQRTRVVKLEFDYELKQWGQMISVVVKTISTKGVVKTEMNTVNFHAGEDRFLTINDILGPNGVGIANKIISEEIKKNPEKYNPNYNDIDNNHGFYVADEAVVIVFDQYEIAAGSQGTPEFSILISGLTNLSLKKDSDYYTKESFGLRMIPLRKVCEAFGYEVRWNNSARAIEVVRASEIVSFVVDRNDYRKGRESRALETAAEITAGTTYVPVSFFRDILGLVYSADTNGTLTFTAYVQP